MTTEKSKRNIHQRMLAVMGQCDYLMKEDVGNGKGLSHDRVIEYVRGPLMDAGIYWCSSCDCQTTRTGEFTTKHGEIKTLFICDGIVTTTFFNMDDPDDNLVVSAPASGSDQVDPASAAGGMYSYGAKLTILKALSIYGGNHVKPNIDTRGYSPAHRAAKHEPVVDRECFEAHMMRLSEAVAARGLDSEAVNQEILRAFGKHVKRMTESELNALHPWFEQRFEEPAHA